MKPRTKSEVMRVLRFYDPEHDSGPEAPVTWREARLADAVIELNSNLLTTFAALDERLARLETTQDPEPSRNPDAPNNTPFTDKQIERLEAYYSLIACETITIQEIKGTVYVFGSELACYRLHYQLKSGRVEFSENQDSWFYARDRN